MINKKRWVGVGIRDRYKVGHSKSDWTYGDIKAGGVLFRDKLSTLSLLKRNTFFPRNRPATTRNKRLKLNYAFVNSII